MLFLHDKSLVDFSSKFKICFVFYKNLSDVWCDKDKDKQC